jgi:3-oxoadipate enol-lactonase
MPTVQSDDAAISYEVTGSGDPLLMIMGFATDSRMWFMQTPAFAASHRCITFDNRASGMSEVGEQPITMERMARDALAVLDAAGADRAHVLGISMGGAIAQHLALIAPDRVRSLTLAATWAGPNAWLPRLTTIGLSLLKHEGSAFMARASMLWVFSPRFIVDNPAMAQVVEDTAAEMATDDTAFTAQLQATSDHDLRARLHEITAPTLVMSAKRDVFVPLELGKEVAALIPGSTYVELDGGHGFNIEEPAAFNETVLGFINAH